jgi:hypothetical protein
MAQLARPTIRPVRHTSSARAGLRAMVWAEAVLRMVDSPSVCDGERR